MADTAQIETVYAEVITTGQTAQVETVYAEVLRLPIAPIAQIESVYAEVLTVVPSVESAFIGWGIPIGIT